MTKAAARDRFIGPAHLTKPERWPQPEVTMYEGVAYCAVSHILTLGANGEINFDFLLKKYLYDGKIGRMPKPPAPKFRSDLGIVPFKRYRRKIAPREAETDRNCPRELAPSGSVGSVGEQPTRCVVCHAACLLAVSGFVWHQWPQGGALCRRRNAVACLCSFCCSYQVLFSS